MRARERGRERERERERERAREREREREKEGRRRRRGETSYRKKEEKTRNLSSQSLSDGVTMKRMQRSADIFVCFSTRIEEASADVKH